MVKVSDSLGSDTRIKMVAIKIDHPKTTSAMTALILLASPVCDVDGSMPVTLAVEIPKCTR